ncbi:MAG: hypothetical protein H0X64_03195 [Gemmatimonadaceae bacterium]|nr:hypothetical protein [Gemmatimonadaceae bacterium]
MRSTLLLLATDPDVLIDVANAARAAGYLVAPGRYHEPGIDALTRTQARVALVHVMHDAANAVAFAGLASHLGTQHFLFARRDASPEERARTAAVSARATAPLLEYDEAAALIQEMERQRSPD